ncbi:MAG: hypothetical protein V2J20_05285 [Wenzhouxiangella sp.]|jgi:hypothetical protein|nr:hypothetical protein [Wenzhouxiangella sp.]
MLYLIRAATLVLCLITFEARADVIWVGNSDQCTGGNTFTSLNAAVLSAAFRAGPDEIRLTNTVTYVGDLNRLELAGWNNFGPGTLVISGGYDDCFGNVVGRSRIGDAEGPIIAVRAGGSGASQVTLRNLVIAGSTSLRGLDVSGGSNVFLQNTIIEDNIAGVIVTGGAFLDIDADSRIRQNLGPGEAEFGGGVRCSGTNSQVNIRGRLEFNLADNGGNLWAESGCSVELGAGAQVIRGQADFGGGAFIADGGSLLALGGASRVAFIDNSAAEDGGGLHLEGTGQAVLINTLFRDNDAGGTGSAIYAVGDGPDGPDQLVMDRASDCPFLISCSELEGNVGPEATIEALNTSINIQRTLFDRNGFDFGTPNVAIGTLHLSSTTATINRSGFIGNETYAPITSYGSDVVVRHLTAVDNHFPENPSLDSWAMTVRLGGEMKIYNSIFANTRGLDGAPSGTFAGVCNLVESTNNWPNGSVIQGSAAFVDVAGGDLRQLPSSPGVDMCNAQPLAPENDRDLEFQLAPVNEFTNRQGEPGQEGGLWDAGVDEVYSTVGEDEFTLTVAKDGTGSGFVISEPLGISCGSNCDETYYQGTLVTLTATPNAGSEFTGWAGCPLANGNECLNAVDSDRTITATFTDTTEFTLTVATAGPGEGTVTSDPAGIDCGVDCNEIYPAGTEVLLTATPRPGDVFEEWSGCPEPLGNQCRYTANANLTVTANFMFRLTLVSGLDVEKVGTGQGRVVSSPPGIDCGDDCSGLYNLGQSVTLTATALPGSEFVGWTDCPNPNGNECELSAGSVEVVTAQFEDSSDQIFADRFEN